MSLDAVSEHTAKVILWLEQDPLRQRALAQAAELRLPDWCIAAGFVRNLIWDRLHGRRRSTPLNDIDLIYFDPTDSSRGRDKRTEEQLRGKSGLNWSVKNQARMHVRNDDEPYSSTSHAMSYWVEVETAIGARLVEQGGEIELVAPFGVRHLFEQTITLNPKRRKPEAFRERIRKKAWLETWPKLRVIETAGFETRNTRSV
ncbi:MAG: nucleotidyltransferase family protein [Pseudomonadota bacterium]